MLSGFMSIFLVVLMMEVEIVGRITQAESDEEGMGEANNLYFHHHVN